MKVIEIGAVRSPEYIAMRPVWKRIEAENLWLETEYYDFDEKKDVASQYNVDGSVLPVFIFFDNAGNELLRLVGEVSRERILQAIHEYQGR